MRLLLAAALALASASALGQDASAAEETKAAAGNKRASTAVNLVAALVTTCAEETDKDACNALQSIQALAECGLNAPNPNACGSWQQDTEIENALEGFMISLVVGNIASLASDCAEETDKDACDILQSILPLAECGLNAPNPNACDQPIADAKAQWETPPAEAEAE